MLSLGQADMALMLPRRNDTIVSVIREMAFLLLQPPSHYINFNGLMMPTCFTGFTVEV